MEDQIKFFSITACEYIHAIIRISELLARDGW